MSAEDKDNTEINDETADQVMEDENQTDQQEEGQLDSHLPSLDLQFHR